jgi:hypothetical protein
MSVVPISPAPTPTRHTGAPIDMLDLEGTVFGHDLVLSKQRDGRYVLHQISYGGRAHRVGTFEDVASVWEAIDAIDTAPGRVIAA